MAVAGASARFLQVRSDVLFASVCEQLLSAGTPVRFRAEGGSMRPTIRNGDVVTLAPVGTRPPAPGDIVAIRTADRLVVHRVVTVHVDSTGQARLVTRGDAHADTDPPVPATAVLGRVTAVHRRTVFTRVRDMCHRWGLASGERWP